MCPFGEEVSVTRGFRADLFGDIFVTVFSRREAK
jgi:hypothetical protein